MNQGRPPRTLVPPQKRNCFARFTSCSGTESVIEDCSRRREEAHNLAAFGKRSASSRRRLRGGILRVAPLRQKGCPLSSSGGEGWGEEAVWLQQRVGFVSRASSRRRNCTNGAPPPTPPPPAPRPGR